MKRGQRERAIDFFFLSKSCSSYCSTRKIPLMAPSPTSHVVVFPFMAHSHTNPLLDLSKAFSCQQLRVTILTIPSNSASISSRIEGFPLISVVELPFPEIDGLPNGCQNLSEIPSIHFFVDFLTATTHLRKPFEQFLQSMKDSGDLPLCVVSDLFLGWTLGICQTFGVPRLVFDATCVLSCLITKTILDNADYTSFSSMNVSDLLGELFSKLPFTLTAADLPDVNVPSNTDMNPFTKFMAEASEAEEHSWGVIVNSFLELESDYIPLFETFYHGGAKAWCIGPTFLYRKTDYASKISNGQDEDSASLAKWLDMHAAEAPESVIYVAFGSQAVLSDAQLDEIALGLEESGRPFLLVVRSTTWCAPEGIEERVKPRGLIVRRFVDQGAVLFHGAVGGFMSHCGWNSVLESLSASVPILAWPMMAEQKLNAKYIVDGLGIGVAMEKGENLLVSREKISACTRELMQGEKGSKARDRARELGRLARQAVEDGGSSDVTLKTLIHQLKHHRSL